MTPTTLLHGLIAVEQDVFAVRSKGRELAAALGLEGQDQIRIAAALSEVGRRMLAALGPATVDFVLEDPESSPFPDSPQGRPMLVLTVAANGGVDDEFVEAMRVTERLVDSWEVRCEPARTTVSMGRRLPSRVARLTPAEIEAIRADITALTAGTPLEELAEHNRQLLATLDEVQAQRDELLRLNAELEETNKGVVALYTELSDELEATNRGVVALYAELDQRNNQVRAASESKTRFLANVSHELRAPVTAIVGLVRLLRDPASDPLTEDQANQLDLIDGSARSLLGLVNELLDLAKAESGRMEPVPAPTHLKAIFDTLRGTLKAVPRSGTTRLVVAEPEGIPTLYTDPVMLTQVLRNLLTNGLKFTPEGEVRLSADYSPETATVALTVSDTGIGIPAEEQERIFEEFHQVRHALHASVTGTGLGLPYARRLVQILGGEITLTSAPGAGSTFTVRLPIGDATRHSPGPDLNEPIRVLVADDDDAFRTAAAMILRAAGLIVQESPDGRSTLTAVETAPPDVILLDLRLAQLDGFAVLDALSADDVVRDIPVVVLTAYPTDSADQPTLNRAAVVLDKGRTTLEDLPRIIREAAAPTRNRSRR